VATGGGGYQWATVVPRAWTIYFAEMAESRLSDRLPEAWVEAASREAGISVPPALSERAPSPRADREAVRQVVREVRSTVFPFHGLR
jgi:acetoin utilization protein AcuC